VCVDHLLNTGIKEDCYGFYPDPKSDAVFVGGSDLAPTRLARFGMKRTQQR